MCDELHQVDLYTDDANSFPPSVLCTAVSVQLWLSIGNYNNLHYATDSRQNCLLPLLSRDNGAVSDLDGESEYDVDL